MRGATLGRVFGMRLIWRSIPSVFGAVPAGCMTGQKARLAEMLILAACVAPITVKRGKTGSPSATDTPQPPGTTQRAHRSPLQARDTLATARGWDPPSPAH